MKLYELLENNAETELQDIEISSVTDNTRKVQEGSLFVCVKGGSFDGHSAAKEMLEKGAAVVIAERDLGLGERQIIVENSRDFYGKLCAKWFDHPEKKMKLIGVTGTNGKTTITNIVKHILTANGHKTGLIGTIRNEIGDEVVETANTTPMAYELMELFDRMVKAGCEYVVMEVSSFGLVQKRIGCCHFDIALFTNLTQDHLDYHKDMEDYYQAKKLLFGKCDIALLNTDDAYGKRLYREISCDKYSFGTDANDDYYSGRIKLKASGSSFWLCANDKSHLIKTKMPGVFNVSNVTAAVAICLNLGININDIINAVESCCGVRGRCEVIPTNRDFTVICDYAHTPDAIENVLKSVKEYTEGRLICLFGCGGNRDASKRPKMAASASMYADKLIITSDNPRNENPDDIIKDILAGVDLKTSCDVITDRKEAIFSAIKHAQKGDVIVLAGKGHEDYQVLADDVHIHFDEREIVAEALKQI